MMCWAQQIVGLVAVTIRLTLWISQRDIMMISIEKSISLTDKRKRNDDDWSTSARMR